MGETARPTLADVAALAGVSSSTASLAFSGSGPVSEATRARVLAAAERLSYAGPDPRARSLRRGRSGIVGVVLEERVRHAFTDPMRIAMLDGLSEELGAIGAGVLLLTELGEGAVPVEDAPVDAMVLVGCSPGMADSVAVLGRRGIPVVVVEGGAPHGALTVDLDNREASRTAAEHLASLGHERVAVVTLPFDRERTRGLVTPELEARCTVVVTSDRLAGVREVFPSVPAIATGGSRVEEGRIAGAALFDVPPAERPTAVVAQSDLLAAGVVRAAEERGLRVPEDVSVVGFDGVRVDGLERHDLTTLVQPGVEKGRAAGRAVLEMLAGRHPDPVRFTSEFHRGATTAPPHG